MIAARETAARHAALFLARIDAALNSTDPQLWHDAGSASSPFASLARMRELLSGSPEQRADAAIELAWWGVSNVDAFRRLFELDVIEQWDKWASDAAMSSSSGVF